MNAQNDFWIGLAGALAALAFVFAQRRKVLRCSEGTERMAHIAAAIRKGEAPLDRLSRLMDYHLVEAEPGEPCPRDALRVCRLLDLEPELMEIFSKNS